MCVKKGLTQKYHFAYLANNVALFLKDNSVFFQFAGTINLLLLLDNERCIRYLFGSFQKQMTVGSGKACLACPMTDTQYRYGNINMKSRRKDA